MAQLLKLDLARCSCACKVFLIGRMSSRHGWSLLSGKNSEWRNDPDHEFAYDCLTSRVWWEKMELVLKVVGPLFCVLRYADQEKNGTVSGFLPKMIQAYNEITGKLRKNKYGKGYFHKKVAEVISKRLRYLLNETLTHAGNIMD